MAGNLRVYRSLGDTARRSMAPCAQAHAVETRCGLVEETVQDVPATFNARCESVGEKLMFRT
jgi:putative SOS response-associated peptidase YedK